MSAEATGWVWKHSPYTGAQLLVHLAMADVVNDANGNEFWMSTYKLAKKAKVSRSTVTTTLSDMLRDGLLLTLSRGGGSRAVSRYQFLMTSAVIGLDVLDQSDAATSAIGADSLARSAREIPKEITQERKAAQIFQKDAEAALDAVPAPWSRLGLSRREWLDLEAQNTERANRANGAGAA